MDNNQFINSFMNIDILKVEGIAEVIGRTVAKLRSGMIVGGMTPEDADALIGSTVEIFLNYMAKLGGHIQ